MLNLIHRHSSNTVIRSCLIVLCMLGSCANNPVSSNQKTYNRTAEFSDGQFLSNAFFFLDSVYLKQSNKRAAHAADTLVRLPGIIALQVWIQADPAELVNPLPMSKYRSVPEFDSLSTRFNVGGDGIVFRQLVQDVHYHVDPLRGYIRIDSPSVRPDIGYLAIFLRTDNPIVVHDKGDTTIIGTTTNGNWPIMKRLSMLKELYPDPVQPTFYLMWRNVYQFPKNVFEPFSISVSKIDTMPSSDRFAGRLVSQILGLTNSEGRPIATREIFDDLNGYMIIPSFADTTIGNQPFRNPAFGIDTNPKPYNLSQVDYAADPSIYKIKFKISIQWNE
jgi:hypothetical protein